MGQVSDFMSHEADFSGVLNNPMNEPVMPNGI